MVCFHIPGATPVEDVGYCKAHRVHSAAFLAALLLSDDFEDRLFCMEVPDQMELDDAPPAVDKREELYRLGESMGFNLRMTNDV